jgi:hypothetical protein
MVFEFLQGKQIFFSKKLGSTQHTTKYVTGAKTGVKDTWSCTSTFPTPLDRVDRGTFTFFSTERSIKIPVFMDE